MVDEMRARLYLQMNVKLAFKMQLIASHGLLQFGQEFEFLKEFYVYHFTGF